jgi:hypothetical protein
VPPAGLYDRVLEEVERPLIQLTLSATRGNQVRAAEILGLNRNTLRKKIQDLGVEMTAVGASVVIWSSLTLNCATSLLSLGHSPLDFRQWRSLSVLEPKDRDPVQPGLVARTKFGRATSLGVGYGFGVVLTATAILLASSPPATGPIGPATPMILAVLGFNLVLILALAGIVGLRLLDLLNARASDAGARLHLRFVTLFSVAAVAPAVIVALFFGVLVNRGVDNWFSERVRTVVENSATVARSYVEEQTAISATTSGRWPGPQPRRRHPGRFAGGFRASSSGWPRTRLPAAYLIDRDGRILARAESAGAPPFLAPPPSSFKPPTRARSSRPALRVRGPDPGPLSPERLSRRLSLRGPPDRQGHHGPPDRGRSR